MKKKIEDIQDKIERKHLKKELKKKKKFGVSGKSVFSLKKLINKDK